MVTQVGLHDGLEGSWNLKSILKIRFLRVGRSWLYTAGLSGFAACGLVCDVLLGFAGRSQEDLGTVPRTPTTIEYAHII